jgi:type IV secretion system protein VirB6
MPCADITIPAALSMALGTDINTNYLTLINKAKFMCDTRSYLIDDMLIGVYREQVAEQLGKALMYLATAIVTAWVMIQGFMIISGSNKTPIVSLAFQTIKMVAILTVVSILAGNSPWIAEMVLAVQGLITTAIVDRNTSNIYQIVDMNLAVSQIFNAVIEGLVGGQQSGADGNRLTTMAGVIGQSGPAVLVSIMAIMAEISITLAIMLAPLFIFFLLFKQTAGMFTTWAKFLLGTMVSFALLTLLSSILLDMMMRYGAAVIAAFYANGALAAAGVGFISFDISGSAMQLAALGSLSTALLIMIPPLIMQFFNSGASFAAGAMMGMMGGGAAGAGAAGLMNSMNGQPGVNGTQGALGASGMNGASGGSGQPGVGYSGAPGTHQNLGSQSVIQALTKLGQGGDSGFSSRPQGSHGLADQGRQFASVQTRQTGMASELRDGSNVSSQGASKQSSNFGTDGTIEDARIKNDSSLGRGGHLGVSGAAPSVGSQVPLNAASKTAAVPAPVGGNAGSNSNNASGASSSSTAEAPTQGVPRGQAGAAGRPTGNAAPLPYGQQGRKP